MKKLALAIVCLMGIAFFTSCDPVNPVENPEPTITIMATEGYLQNGQVIDLGVEYPYGFIAASNPETMKELSHMTVTCGETVICDTTITGTEFKFEGTIYFEDTKDTIIGHAEIIAVVKDVAGESNTATIKVDINKVETLEATPFEWRRDNGADGVGLAEFGLQWTKNVTEKTVAKIEPLNGATLTVFTPEDWTNTTTAAQKAALFTEVLGVSEYKEVSTTASNTYDLVIGTIYNGETHLIHITKCEVYERGWHFVITGDAK